MHPELIHTTAELHLDDLRREADHARLVAAARGSRAWRRRAGAALIRAGRRVSGEPAEPVTRPRPRVA